MAYKVQGNWYCAKQKGAGRPKISVEEIEPARAVYIKSPVAKILRHDRMGDLTCGFFPYLSLKFRWA